MVYIILEYYRFVLPITETNIFPASQQEYFPRLLQCHCCNWGHLNIVDQSDYRKITIHSGWLWANQQLVKNNNNNNNKVAPVIVVAL